MTFKPQLRRINICLAIAAIAVGLVGCSDTRLVAVDGALRTDGRCIYRTVNVFDRVMGYYVPVQQRFCGGRTVIVE